MHKSEELTQVVEAIHIAPYISRESHKSFRSFPRIYRRI